MKIVTRCAYLVANVTSSARRQLNVFHVKQQSAFIGKPVNPAFPGLLFTNTKSRKDMIQQILDINMAGDPPQGRSSAAIFLS